jgi:hypothetical protein
MEVEKHGEGGGHAATPRPASCRHSHLVGGGCRGGAGAWAGCALDAMRGLEGGLDPIRGMPGLKEA